MRRPSARYLDLPFSEATEFFRQKTNMPSRAWDDLWQGMHSRAFVVAGATKTELLGDLRGAVDTAITNGTTLAAFRRDFDGIVQKHGWNHKGARGWRSAIIYDTNLSVAYAAGHHRSITDPAVLAARPYWRYLPSSAAHPRMAHRKWYNLVLRHDDPFWKTHSPPNGWGCHCGLTTATASEVKRLRREEAGGPYPIQETAPEQEGYDYLNKKTGEISQVPVGIDPGWDYNPGEAAWGRRLSQKNMAEYAAMKRGSWEQLTPGNWQTYGLAEQLSPDTMAAMVGPKISTISAATAALEEILGGAERVYSLTGRDGFRYDLLLNAEILIKHLDLNRTPYLPLIPEALLDPQEVWMRFERHKMTGRVVLRQRILKNFPLGQHGLLLIGDAVDGWITAWTMIPVRSWTYTNNQRTGLLVYRKEEKRKR